MTTTEPTTPQPFYLQGPPASEPPPAMNHPEKMRLRAAAFRATKLYPGPVAELIARELLAWEDFGYRFATGGFIAELLEHISTAPLTETADTAV